jgi:hypothetical protein
MSKKQSNQAKQKTTSVASPKNDFWAFLLSPENRLLVGLVLAIQLSLFIFLKVRFPYPLSESDSGNYILSAFSGTINGYRPYGYSGFMRFFHSFSDNIQFVNTWQYFILALAAFLILFTVQYFFRLKKWLFILLAVFVLVNPSLLYLSVYLMSDSLFVSMTALWIVSAIWLLHGGAWWVAIVHLLCMYWSIDIRYIGMFYPALTALVLGYRFWQTKWLAGLLAVVPFLLLFWYRADQTTKMKETFGVETFSAFGGWQKANNGVAVLPFVKVDETQITDPVIKSIHSVVRSFPDSLFTFPNVEATNFMWVKGHPGKAYLFQYIQQTGTPYLKAWVYCGTMMEKYGDWLQKSYPVEYFTAYILPNAANIFKVWEIMEGEKFVADANTKQFFKSDVEEYVYPTHFFKPMTQARTIADAIIWVGVFISLILFFVAYKKKAFSNAQWMTVLFLLSFIGLFLAVSVYAAPINNFRYLMPIYFTQILLIVLAIHALISPSKKAV